MGMTCPGWSLFQGIGIASKTTKRYCLRYTLMPISVTWPNLAAINPWVKFYKNSPLFIGSVGVTLLPLAFSLPEKGSSYRFFEVCFRMDNIISFITKPTENLNEMIQDISEKYTGFQEKFMKQTEIKAEQLESYKFWLQFVFEDCFAYVGLYLAIRSGKWDLRMASIKQMARPLIDQIIRN